MDWVKKHGAILVGIAFGCLCLPVSITKHVNGGQLLQINVCVSCWKNQPASYSTLFEQHAAFSYSPHLLPSRNVICYKCYAVINHSHS